MSEHIALQQAAALCQPSMYEFYKRIEKYQPHLTMRAAGGGKNWLKDGWMKIKWATCRTEDVELFQAELRGHRCLDTDSVDAPTSNCSNTYARSRIL